MVALTSGSEAVVVVQLHLLVPVAQDLLVVDVGLVQLQLTKGQPMRMLTSPMMEMRMVVASVRR